MMWIYYRIIFPMSLLMAKIFRLHQDYIAQKIIKYNNKLVKKRHLANNRILILVPRCLQFQECTNNVVGDIANCKKCGKCQMKDLVNLAEHTDNKIVVATGGEIARRIIEETKATTVLAIACEKELISGIIDTYPIKVYAIINQRPQGPCVNTQVEIEEVKKILKNI